MQVTIVNGNVIPRGMFPLSLTRALSGYVPAGKSMTLTIYPDAGAVHAYLNPMQGEVTIHPLLVSEVLKYAQP